MRIIPKKTKYHLAFRNKIQTKKIIAYDNRIKNALNSKHVALSNFFKINGWVPKFPSENKKTYQPVKHNYLSYDYSHQLLFGSYGIIFEKHGKLSAKYIETVNLDIAKLLKKKSKVWLRICCDTPVTARPVETRMGKGKGAISHWEAKVFPGQVFFEFSGLTDSRAKQILANLQRKAPIDLKLVTYYSYLA